MRKCFWIIIVVLCCALVMVVAACGKKDNNTPTDSTHTDNTSTDNTQPAVQLANFVNIAFADQTVEYDGDVHTLLAEGVPEGASVTYSNNSGSAVGTYEASVNITKDGYNPLTLRAVLQVTVPSAQSVITARAAANEDTTNNYNFLLNMAGSVAIAGYSGTANARYDGKYRYNSETGDLQFSRTTSGLLLYDATEYIALQGDTKLKVTANDKGVVKKVNVMVADDEELLLVNKPIVAIVDALKADNLTNIALSANSGYMFQANIRLSGDNTLVNKVLAIVAKQGTSISMKGVSFTNPVNGLVLYFNLGKDKKLDSFALSAALSIPVAGNKVELQLDYSQVADDKAIAVPSLGNLVWDKNAIGAELTKINGAMGTLKASKTYSLDVEAINETDPGWTTMATKDRYTARMYKNTYQLNGVDFCAFNHSFEYKTHHEEDGAETYKYTIGNIKDGTAHMVSRKDSNTITALDDVDADTQFDWLTDAFAYTAEDIDCLRKEVKGSVTTYTLYLNNAGTVAVGQKVSEMINSNTAEGVVPVENYFDDADYVVNGCDMVIAINNGKLASINVQTSVKYNPTAGEYTQKRVTLQDSLAMVVNDKLSDAQKYEAPTSTTTKLGSFGLNNGKFYIL